MFISRGMNRNNNCTSIVSAPGSSPRRQRGLTLNDAATPYIPSSVRCPPVLDPFGRAQQQQQLHYQLASRRCDISLLKLGTGVFESEASSFEWLSSGQRNNSSGESSSRKLASKETCRREVENWCYMHLRIRMEGYRSIIYAIKQAFKDENLFSEEHLDKWTIKMKFRIRKAAPLKLALIACAARLGLENDADIIFCTDGFYGDTLTGRANCRYEVANRVVQATTTCRAMGLTNGDSLFLSRATRSDRDNAQAQVQLDFQRITEADSSDGSSARKIVTSSGPDTTSVRGSDTSEGEGSFVVDISSQDISSQDRRTSERS